MFLNLLLKHSRLLGALFNIYNSGIRTQCQNIMDSPPVLSPKYDQYLVSFLQNFFGQKARGFESGKQSNQVLILRYGFIGSLSEPNSIKVGSLKE